MKTDYIAELCCPSHYNNNKKFLHSCLPILYIVVITDGLLGDQINSLYCGKLSLYLRN